MSVIDPLLPVSMNIDSIVQEAPNVFTLALSSENKKLFNFKPGQFNMISAFGVGEAAVSLSGSAEDPRRLQHTIRVVGEVTRKLNQLKVDQKVALRGPFGSGWPIELLENKDLLLIAGGIGLAPIRPVLDFILKKKGANPRVHLIYGARTPQDLLFKNDLDLWKSLFQTTVTVDHHLRPWSGHVGVVTQHIRAAIKNPRNTLVFLCGPEAMMRFSLYTLNDCNIPKENIYMSMERNMQCAIGQCGRCQWGPFFICKDGPVIQYSAALPFIYKKEL